MRFRSNHRGPARRGAIMPLVAVMLPVLLILASFIVNVSYMELARTELRIASDAASRAAGHTLIRTGDMVQATTAAQHGGQRNQVAGQSLAIDASDIQFGISTRTSIGSKYSFTPNTTNPNAVRVNARRDSGSGGAINLIIPMLGGAAAFEPVQTGITSQVELDVALVLDRSGSMAYGDYEDSVARASAGLGPEIAAPGWWFGDAAPEGSRWLDLVDAVDVFLTVLQNSPQSEYVTLVTYNDSAVTDTPLTNNYGDVLTGMDAYSQALDAGATNIHAGIDEGLDALGRPSYGRMWAAKVVIVLTDGKHNSGSGPESAAHDAFEAGVAVYTVTFSDDAEQGRMQDVADDGGGKHFHAATSNDLQEAFREIARNLPTLLTE